MENGVAKTPFTPLKLQGQRGGQLASSPHSSKGAGKRDRHGTSPKE